MQRLLVVQLTEIDMAELLMLVESEAVASKKHSVTYWQEVLERMREQINLQLAGEFFQCAACLSQEWPKVS